MLLLFHITVENVSKIKKLPQNFFYSYTSKISITHDVPWHYASHNFIFDVYSDVYTKQPKSEFLLINRQPKFQGSSKYGLYKLPIKKQKQKKKPLK